MAGGPKTTTTDNSNSQSQSTSQQQQAGVQNQYQFGSTTPNLPSWFSGLKQSIPGMYQPALGQLLQQGTGNLYGPQQQASFQQGLNSQYGNASQALQSQLASRGMLNSIAGNQAQTQLALGKGQQLGNYLAQVPMLNRQAQQSALGQYGNMLGNLQNLTIPYGQSTAQGGGSSYSSSGQGTQDTTQQSQSQQVQQQSGGFLNSLLGGLLNAGLGFATGGLSNILGGGQGGGGNMLSTLMQSPSSGIQAPQMQVPSFGGFSQGNPYNVNYGLNNVGSLAYNPTFGVGQ